MCVEARATREGRGQGQGSVGRKLWGAEIITVCWMYKRYAIYSIELAIIVRVSNRPIDRLLCAQEMRARSTTVVTRNELQTARLINRKTVYCLIGLVGFLIFEVPTQCCRTYTHTHTLAHPLTRITHYTCTLNSPRGFVAFALVLSRVAFEGVARVFATTISVVVVVVANVRDRVPRV